MRFKLKKDKTFFVFLVLFPVAIAIYTMALITRQPRNLEPINVMVLGFILLMITCFIYFLCIKTYYDNYYIIQNNKLICKIGLSKKIISIDSVKSISKDTYPVAGIKPALSYNGITIKYDAGYSMFISPKEEEHFISELRAHNSRIEIFNFDFLS